MRKVKPIQITYQYVEPKTPEEKAEQQRRLDAVYDILFTKAAEQMRIGRKAQRIIAEKMKNIDDKVKNSLNKLDLQNHPAYDHVRAAILAGVNAIPYIGSPLGSLMDSYIPTQKEKRIFKFIDEISQEVEKVKDKVKQDNIHTDEFAFLFEKTFKGVFDNYQKEKIDAYKAIFINALIDKGNIETEQKEVFLHILDNLTVRHLRILAVVNAHNSGDLTQTVQQYYPSYAQEEIYYIMDDLRNMGLIPAKGQLYDQGLNVNFNQLSETGKRFVQFISIADK